MTCTSTPPRRSASVRPCTGASSALIAYGTQIRSSAGTQTLKRHGLEPEKYFLFVGRLIPEKGVHYLIDAYRQVETEFPLVIVGDNPYHPEYVQQLKDSADERVLFLGGEFGEAFWELCANCYVYVQPSEVEGTSPVVLSAMGCGRCVVVNGIRENLDTIGEAGLAFFRNDVSDLAGLLRGLLANPKWVRQLGAAAQARARELECTEIRNLPRRLDDRGRSAQGQEVHPEAHAPAPRWQQGTQGRQR